MSSTDGFSAQDYFMQQAEGKVTLSVPVSAQPPTFATSVLPRIQAAQKTPARKKSSARKKQTNLPPKTLGTEIPPGTTIQ
jgi:hypothetical protein